MKSIARFLLIAVGLTPMGVFAAVPTTVGSNLTAYNSNMGAINNNAWNQMTNPRGGASAPTADFGNCNALILRCASPKCAGGGCASMDIAVPIVSGCVQSNATCKKYGDDLTQYIAAQLVSDANAVAAQNAASAQAAAAQNAAAQSAQQMQQMQAQMQQMQSQMAQQNAMATQQLQAALEEQKQLTAQAIADAAAAQANAATVASPSGNANLTQSQVSAATAGISAEVLAREQISGQIMSKVENAMVAMKELKASMENTFAYAGCDTRGNNCTGPRRVKMFKEKAQSFFDPYNAVLDEIYDALIMAQSLGVDITDIYMMLNGTCNAWAKYLCMQGQQMHYTSTNCPNGYSTMSGAKCSPGTVIPMSDGGCQLIQMLTNQDEVQQNWLYPDSAGATGGGDIRVGCASEALDNSVLFRNRKKQASIDIETLQRIIEQDAPNILGSARYAQNKTAADVMKYCAVNDDSYETLVQAVTLKKLPDAKVCVNESELDRAFVPYSPKFTSEEIKAMNALGEQWWAEYKENIHQENVKLNAENQKTVEEIRKQVLEADWGEYDDPDLQAEQAFLDSLKKK